MSIYLLGSFGVKMDAFAGFDFGTCNFFAEFFVEKVFINRKGNRLSQPAGKVHTVGKCQAVDAFFTSCNQRFAMQNMTGKCCQYTIVLRVKTIRFNLNPFSLRLCKTFLGSKAEFPFTDFQLINRQLEIIDMLCCSMFTKR